MPDRCHCLRRNRRRMRREHNPSSSDRSYSVPAARPEQAWEPTRQPRRPQLLCQRWPCLLRLEPPLPDRLQLCQQLPYPRLLCLLPPFRPQLWQPLPQLVRRIVSSRSLTPTTSISPPCRPHTHTSHQRKPESPSQLYKPSQRPCWVSATVSQKVLPLCCSPSWRLSSPPDRRLWS